MAPITARVCVLVGILPLGCSSPTANYCDDDTPCTDPARPYCDRAGDYGDGNTCIASPFDAAPDTVTLAVDLRGEGRVLAAAVGIDCPGACEAEVSPGTEIELEQLPGDGNSFVTWSGPCDGFGTCTLAPSEDVTAIAIFEPEGAVQWTASATLSEPIDSASPRVLPNALAIDSLGDVILVGSTIGTPDFGGGPLESGDPTFGSSEVVLVKLGADGAHRWSHAFSGTGYSDDAAHDVRIAGGDDIWIVGGFEDGINFGGAGDALDGSVHDQFLARFDSAGAHVSSTGTAGDSWDQSLALDGDGRLAVAGRALRIDLYDAQGASLGNVEPTPSTGTFSSTVVDGFGRLVATGSITGRIDFAPDATGGELGADATVQGFVAKLAWDGSYHSGRAFENVTYHCVVAEPTGDGSYFVVGSLDAQVDLQGGGGGVITPTGTRNGFVARFSNSHAHLWSVHIPSSDVSEVTACALDARGRLVVGGSFTTDVRLTPTAPMQTGTGTFVAVYDADDGTLMWGRFGFGTGAVVDVASDHLGRAAAAIEYRGGTFTLGDDSFPSPGGNGASNVIVVQHAP